MKKLFRTFVLMCFLLGAHAIQSYAAICSCVGSFAGIFMATTVYTVGSSCYSSAIGCRITTSFEGQIQTFWGDDTDCATAQFFSGCFQN
ncbi:MAG: hypothetical protein U0Y10_12370 [Spirosomataceae bacterium]